MKNLEMATSLAASVTDDYGKHGKKDKTEIFHVFILFFNKCIHSPSFLGGSWTCLDFSFLPLPAALDCAIFVFIFPLKYLSVTSISHRVSMNDKTHFFLSGLNRTIAQSETTLKLY